MSDATFDTPDPAVETGSNAEQLVEQILALIGDAQPISSDERRVRERFPICYTMRLTPISQSETPLADETAIIVGKDLSRRGISFSHDFPLSHRRIVISFTHPEVGQFSVEAEVTWTRRTPIGLYESGCRLIKKVAGHNVSLSR